MNPDQGRRKTKTLTVRAVGLRAKAEHAADPTLRRTMRQAELLRPRFRSECVGGPRPCPFVSCRFHLALEVTPAGGLKANWPDRDLEELPATCALDVADAGPSTLERVAGLINVTREFVRQLEQQALKHALAPATDLECGP